ENMPKHKHTRHGGPQPSGTKAKTATHLGAARVSLELTKCLLFSRKAQESSKAVEAMLKNLEEPPDLKDPTQQKNLLTCWRAYSQSQATQGTLYSILAAVQGQLLKQRVEQECAESGSKSTPTTTPSPLPGLPGSSMSLEEIMTTTMMPQTE